MMHSPAAKIISKVAWAITALNAINTGLMPRGYDFFTSEFVMMRMPSMMNGLYYLVGIAGVVSLVSLVMCCMKNEHCDVNVKACSRCGSMTGCSCR